MEERLRPLAIFVLQLRATLKWLILSIVALTAVLFVCSSDILTVMQGHLGEELYFFSVAGPFLAHVKLAFFAALYLLAPLCMYVFWKAAGKPFGVTGSRLFWYVLSTCLLFYAGTIFCYLVTLPFGIRFLLGFQTQDVQAMISVTRFVNFTTLFVLAFGLIFELPVFMIFSVQTGLVSRELFIRNRRYAVLVIAILAALLTPTPDVVNMALMGCPLYLLYEAGILLTGFIRTERRPEAPARTGDKAGDKTGTIRDAATGSETERTDRE
ncbi:MAG: twin-arginine translocase subunit TatC [Desulfobulbus sp.]|jgi:sec-independent protein translocase protein TatC